MTSAEEDGSDPIVIRLTRDEIIEVIDAALDGDAGPGVGAFLADRLFAARTQRTLEPCAWCESPATGSAESVHDGKRYPSCGERGHGLMIRASL